MLMPAVESPPAMMWCVTRIMREITGVLPAIWMPTFADASGCLKAAVYNTMLFDGLDCLV